jgi:hypothetical protein
VLEKSDGGLKDNCESKDAESLKPDCSVLKSQVSSSMANKFRLSKELIAASSSLSVSAKLKEMSPE